MPCYCDIPDEEDKIKIEDRCKTRMYFDVQSLMTSTQVHKSNEMHISQFPVGDCNISPSKELSIFNLLIPILT